MATRRFPLDRDHGRFPLGTVLGQPPRALGIATGSPDGEAVPADRLIYLDTETTGLAGGTGTYAFMVGVGFFERGHFTLRQYFMEDLDQEPALIAALAALLPRFDGVVTYNGRAFDLPLLETRFILGRRRWPEVLASFDLLRPSRSLWKDALPDCRLSTIEEEVLGVKREDDVPGAVIPSLYFSYLRERRPGPIARVFAHNETDILSLVALAGWHARAVHDPKALGLSPEEWVGLGRIWERVDWERALDCHMEAFRGGLPGELRRRLAKRLAHGEKRRGRWEEARQLWEECIAHEKGFDPTPWEELAKHYEHRSKRYAAAREIALAALDRARDHRAADFILARLEHRLARLERRLSSTR